MKSPDFTRKIRRIARFLVRTFGRSGPPKQATLYSRAGCHLCQQAQEVLERHGLRISVVDVDAQPDLRARYGLCVPVVVIDGRERFRGRVDEVLLRRLLARRSS